MKCVMCESEDVATAKDGTYLPRVAIPVLQNKNVVGRILIRYPRDLPLCRKCRGELVTEALSK